MSAQSLALVAFIASLCGVLFGLSNARDAWRDLKALRLMNGSRPRLLWIVAIGNFRTEVMVTVVQLLFTAVFVVLLAADLPMWFRMFAVRACALLAVILLAAKGGFNRRDRAEIRRIHLEAQQKKEGFL